MCITVPGIPKEQVAELVDHLNTSGFGFIPNYLSPSDLERVRGFASKAVEDAGGQYVHFNGPASVAGSGLEELAVSPDFTALMHQVYELGTGKAAQKQDFYQVLRCLSGDTGQKNSLNFHYDSYVVTALLPIHIPEQGRAGDLLMYPNTRKIRGSYLANTLDKVLLDNPATQWLLRSRVDAALLKPVRIKMQPGNLYFFWGYRSIHTNEPCDADKIRATALFHYHNPHKKPQLLRSN